LIFNPKDQFKPLFKNNQKTPNNRSIMPMNRQSNPFAPWLWDLKKPFCEDWQ